ncbi:MAG TPA: glycosyl transferase [Patescibacteria group bacterium]|nr:glycosyl transferase [Patescibacteria group bacterium]
MKYGYFDKKNKEYVITRPDTPTPWINYLGQDEYCAMISNTAGGYSFHKDPRDRRLLRYRYNGIPVDRPGRYVYIRDNASSEYWSTSWQPVVKDLSGYQYECRHGMGYTKIASAYNDIRTETTYFVPLKENLEVYLLRIDNLRASSRQLSVFSYVEFCLWQALMDMQDFQYSLNISRAECVGNTIYHLTGYYPHVRRNTFAFFSVNRAIEGFDTDREAFIGNYRDEARPLVVEEGRSLCSVNRGGNPIGSHHLKVALGPGEQACLIFILGIEENKASAAAKIRKYQDVPFVQKKFQELAQNWDRTLVNLQVETPDDDINTMVNVWNQYQCRTTFNWARSASFYESGIGRGMGFRDANQDTLGVLHTIAPAVKQRIIDLAKNQFKRGDSYHQYFPLTRAGDKTGYSDDHLWLVVSAGHYIKETGDFGFLKEKVPYADGPAEPIYKHLLRAVGFSFQDCGVHGIPHIGYADWNDCLNNVGEGAESVWVGQFLCYATRELAILAGRTGKKKDAVKLQRLYKKMADTINARAWDGAWYVRVFDYKGRPVGSKKCKEGGKIHLNSQTWAVLSGIADQARSLTCMDSVKRFLDTRHGVKLAWPAYKTFYPYIGAVGTFCPGLKENGGIFCHANPWVVIAETLMRRGDRAYEYYKKTCPSARNDIADIQKTEPYVYAQFIAGDESPEFGRSRNSWLTGSASWNLVAVSRYILGVRPDYDGLLIDPCIPKEWDSFRLKRVFRGAAYNIEVRNPHHVSCGIKSIELDEKKIKGNIIPICKQGREHSVTVTMG